jgi:hypothetical protein
LSASLLSKDVLLELVLLVDSRILLGRVVYNIVVVI